MLKTQLFGALKESLIEVQIAMVLSSVPQITHRNGVDFDELRNLCEFAEAIPID